MGHIEIEKSIQEVSLITPGFEEEKEKKQLQQKHETQVKTDTETYYERILKNSRDQNTALRIKSYDKAEKGEWSVPEVNRRPAFRQKLPAARDSFKERRAEKAAMAEAKQTFADADLCTVREKATLEAYFSGLKNGELGISGEDAADNPDLTEYVDSILKMELNNAVFTDDYLSDHMAELWEYARKLGNFSYTKEKYPKFFAHLSDEKRALLETRAAAVSELRTLLKEHMNLHGLRVDYDTNGFHVRLRRVEDEAKSPRQLKADYEKNRDKFLKARVYEDEVNLARTYTGLDSFDSKTAKAELDGRLASNARAMEVCGDEMKAASSEIEKAWKVRDGLLADQKLLLKRYDAEKNEAKKSELRTKIVRNNHRIRLASDHADHYRDFLDFVTGEVYTVRKGTARFLETENQKDMLELVRIKAMGDFIEEALVGNRKMEARKKLASLKKDIEVKDSDKVEGFELIDYKPETADEIRKLEEAIKGMTYIRMPLDMFYSKITAFKEARTKGRRFMELKKAGMERSRSAGEAARQYAGRFEIESIAGTDRYLPLFCEPIHKDEKKAGINVLTSMDTFALFTGFKDNVNLLSNVREEIRSRGKSFLDEITSITPEKMLEYKCPAEPDIENAEFWHKRSIVWAMHDYQSTLDCFRQWNIALTDEQYAHIMGLSVIAQGMVRDYMAFEVKMEDPISVAADDERLIGDTLNTLCDNIAYPYRDGDNNVPDDKEVHDRLKKFGLNLSGLTMNIFMDKKRRDTNVLEATSYYIYEKNLSAGMDTVPDVLEEYRKEKERHLTSPEFEEEKKLMKEFFPDAGDEEVRERLLIKEQSLRRERTMTDELEQEWKLNFGDSFDGAGDLRSFAILLRPVHCDRQGVLTEESRENVSLNRRDVRDYMSGDVKRRNRVLRRIGKEMAAISLTEDMLTFDYLQKNHAKLYPITEKILCFQNIWKEYPDFFESDAFTEEERDRIRQNLIDSNVLINLSSVHGQFRNTYAGESIQRKQGGMTKEEKEAWGRSCANTYTGMSLGMMELDDPELGVAGALKVQKKRTALYADKDKADRIRRASVLWVKTKAELEKVTRDRKMLLRRISGLPEGGRKQKLQREADARSAEYDEKLDALKAKLGLADEIKSFVYEEKDKLSEAAKTLFDTEMKESVIHVEYAADYEEKSGKSSEDKAGSGEPQGDSLEEKAKSLSRDALTAAFEELDEEEVREQQKEAKSLIQERPSELEKSGKEKSAGQKQQEENQQQAPQAPVYHAEASLAGGTVYEPQGYLNCWACSGAALFNKFVELSDGELTQKVNQYDIRGFRPGKGELKTLKEINAISGVEVDMDWYNTNLSELYKFMGKDAKDNGNIFEAADFFMKKRKDFALNQMEFRLNGGMEKEDIEAYEAQKALFMKQVNDVLNTGNLVALYKSEGKHYVTITKIDGDYITYMDSLVEEGHPARTVTEPVEVLFSRGSSGNNMSITWFSKLKSPQEMKKDYPYLSYDEHEGYSYSRKEDLNAGALNLAQTRGICITRSESDPVLGKDAVKHHIYIPRLGDEPVQMEQQAGGEQQMQQQSGEEQRMQKEEEKRAFEEQKAKSIIEKQEKWKKREKEIKRERTAKGVVLDAELYTQANKSAVKKGAFSSEALKAGEKFMSKVDAWADVTDDQEKKLLTGMGIRDTVDMLYVSGVPLKQFVAERYAYTGDDVKILRSYAAMIAGRQKFPIILARPVLNDRNEVEVVTEALVINSEALGVKRSKTGSEEYRKAQEAAKQRVRYTKETELKIRGVKELGKLNNDQGSEVLTTLMTSMEGLLELNDGTSYAYYSAVDYIAQYYTALQAIYANDESRMIDNKAVNSLTYQIIQINSRTAGYKTELKEKYPKKGQKLSADDRARVKGLNDVLKILEGHDKKLRSKDLASRLMVPDTKVSIDKVL